MALFLRDRRYNTTRMITVTHAGNITYGPKDVMISPDGKPPLPFVQMRKQRLVPRRKREIA